MHPGRPLAGVALALCVVVFVGGCVGGAGGPGAAPAARPQPAPPGVPLGDPVVATIGNAGGTIASSDARLTVDVPAGAVSAPTSFSVQEITNTAPGGVGSAYRISPHGDVLGTPVTLVFRPNVAPESLDGLAVATQEGQGFWLRQRDIVRDPAANTLTATVEHFSDWAVQQASTDRDLRGTFTIDSTVGLSLRVTGEALLDFAGEDTEASYYLQSGTISAPAAIASGSSVCAPDRPTHELFTNLAELVKQPLAFNWGVSGHWPLTCTSSGGGSQPDFISVAFDTYGINLIECARSYTGTPVITPSALQGAYTIDCGAKGKVTASWDFVTCVAGTPCASSNACHTAVISCSTGYPVCTDTGNVADGTSCGTNAVCGGGVCNSCTAGEACASSNPCHTAVISCSTGVPVCTDTGNVADGTSCGTNAVCGGGVCNSCTAGATCTSSNPCHTAAITCGTGAAVCSDTGNVADGTSCGTDQVCRGGVCGTCVADVDCTPPDACTVYRTSCSTGVSVCVNTGVPRTDGTSCGTNQVCGGGTCNACTEGAQCAASDACHSAAITCSSGYPVCRDGAALADGTSCGTNQVCGGGVCVACEDGASCSPDSCHTGAISCTSGAPTCVVTGTLADGTTCGTDQVCSGGVCVTCLEGVDCTPEGACTAYQTSCASGVSTCVDTGTPLADGTSCGTLAVCTGGVCL